MTFGSNSWSWVITEFQKFLTQGQKIDASLERLPITFSQQEKNQAQWLLLGTVRNWGFLRESISTFAEKSPPRPRLRALLAVSGFELLESDSINRPQVTHHAVEQAKSLLSSGEAKLVNAFLRQLPDFYQKVQTDLEKKSDSKTWSVGHSHPEKFINRWKELYGNENTLSLLEWNQSPAPTYLYVSEKNFENGFSFLEPTDWPHFYSVTEGGWPEAKFLLESGKAYAQDPATRIPVDFIPKGESLNILDLCAAPGGKSRLILENFALGALKGKLVSVDLPGPRFERMLSNLRAHSQVASWSGIAKNILLLEEKDFSSAEVPTSFEVVLVDVPCSNTGVFRRKPDTKWRLEKAPHYMTELNELQLSLLIKASQFVAPEGTLLYSTCSIESEENAQIVEQFLHTQEGEAFTLKEQKLSFPWEAGHDGGGAFCLRKG